MITNQKHLLHILKTNQQSLESILESVDSFYYEINKPKINKNTGKPILDKKGEPVKRTLSPSTGNLKKLQDRIYLFLSTHTTIPSYAFGGIKGKSNIKNARYHQGNKYIFTTDIKSFFPSITNKMVFNMFIREGCTPSIARTLTKLTTYKYKLPQGSSTSSLIANLVFKPIGQKLDLLAKEKGLKFTTFIDDVTISSKTDFKNSIPEIINIIEEGGFKISHKKTNYKTCNPIITGVICHNNSLVIPRIYKKKKAKLVKQLGDNKAFIERKIQGLENYMKSIENA